MGKNPLSGKTFLSLFVIALCNKKFHRIKGLSISMISKILEYLQDQEIALTALKVQHNLQDIQLRSLGDSKKELVEKLLSDSLNTKNWRNSNANYLADATDLAELVVEYGKNKKEKKELLTLIDKTTEAIRA